MQTSAQDAVRCGSITAEILKVVHVGVAIETGRASIATGVGIPCADGDFVDGVVDVGIWAGLEPVLLAGVRKSEHNWRETGHGVVKVRRPVFRTSLRGHEFGEGDVAYAWRADGVEVGGISMGC